MPTASQTHPASPERAVPWAFARLQWMPAWLGKRIFGKPLAPTHSEWLAVQQALGQGDPAMDKVVAWMFAGSARDNKALFEQALMQGLDSMESPPAPLREFFSHIDTPPAWLKPELLEEGAHAAQLGGMVAFYVLRDLALMGGYVYFNSMNQTLAPAGALHQDTSLRLGETGKWLQDVTEPGGLSRFNPGFTTTIRVRLVHALIRRQLQSRPEWNTAKWGAPINQVDMLATYLAFGPVTLTGSRLFGVPVGKKESAAVLHLWRYIGWLSGLEEQWLVESEGDGLRKLYHTFLTHRRPDEKIRLLGQALMREPLQRHLPGMENKPLRAKLKRWWLYQLHLSNSALILGPVQRYRLGLPMFILPWYPLLSAPLRFCKLSWYRWRGGPALVRMAQRNREQQQALLRSYFNTREIDIIRPGAGHPARVE
ncbi:MAG: oxygenase MpaB family protein [Moraxellaceae bacterium]